MPARLLRPTLVPSPIRQDSPQRRAGITWAANCVTLALVEATSATTRSRIPSDTLPTSIPRERGQTTVVTSRNSGTESERASGDASNPLERARRPRLFQQM